MADKCLTLLWQIWLIAGPTQESVQAWLDTVRVIITDWGTEASLEAAPDVVNVFFEFLLTGKVQYHKIVEGTYLFKRAFVVPGWCHSWDNLTKDACHKLPWWPAWLAQLKSCVRFFRYLSYRVTISRALHCQISDDDIAALFNMSCSFAKWRWQTLFQCTTCMRKLQFLTAYWALNLLSGFQRNIKTIYSTRELILEYSNP